MKAYSASFLQYSFYLDACLVYAKLLVENLFTVNDSRVHTAHILGDEDIAFSKYMGCKQ